MVDRPRIGILPTMETTTYESASPKFGQIVAGNETVQCLHTGGRWLEGPVYFGDLDLLLFSDIPNDRILRYVGGQVTTFRQPSRHANGNTRDCEGRLISCEHSGRQVTRTEIDGTITILADSVTGKRLNSPNDVVVKSDGSVWFTDPDYGIISNYEGDKADSEIGANLVYRIDPGNTEPVVVTDAFDHPNGLAFSPDESLLYIVDSGDQKNLDEPFNIRRFRVGADNTLSDAEEFADVVPRGPDGVRVDVEGNVWTTAGKGIQCYAPDGTLLGKINVPEKVANLEFGGPRFNQIFITATTSLYSIHVKTEGASRR